MNLTLNVEKKYYFDAKNNNLLRIRCNKFFDLIIVFYVSNDGVIHVLIKINK